MAKSDGNLSRRNGYEAPKPVTKPSTKKTVTAKPAAKKTTPKK